MSFSAFYPSHNPHPRSPPLPYAFPCLEYSIPALVILSSLPITLTLCLLLWGPFSGMELARNMLKVQRRTLKGLAELDGEDGGVLPIISFVYVWWLDAFANGGSGSGLNRNHAGPHRRQIFR